MASLSLLAGRTVIKSEDEILENVERELISQDELVNVEPGLISDEKAEVNCREWRGKG